MEIVSAFIGRSFDKKEELLWNEVRKILDSLKPMGFSWEDAEEAQAKPISDKVKERIERNDLFIGILTKGKPIMTGDSVSKGKHLLFRKVTNWLASYWIIQESGYAIGRGKKVTFLIENGLELPGGLNADFQYVSVDRNNLSDTIIKVTQIISNEIATRITALGIPVVSKGTELIPSQKAEIQEPEVIEEDEHAFGVVMEAIIKKDFAAANEKFNLFLQDEKVKSSPGLEKYVKIHYYKKLYLAGQPDALDELIKIAKENPTDLDALQALVECFELYDQYNEAIKTIESITKSEADFDFKFNVSILLSRMEGKQKLYDNAKKRLSDFLITLESNSSHQNYLIFKTLGDIFKEQGELHMACFLYELSLNYEPTDSDLRFTLAYGYGEIKKYALAAYHYKAYLNTNEWPVALNNLGIEYENLKLLGKSVSALKRAESLHETLANANLSRMYIEKGFYDEAENILIKALEKKGYNKNVDYYLNNLKASKEQEEENEKKLLEEIKGHKDFALEFAKAISIPFDKYGEINGLWVTDYGELQEFKIQFDAPHKLTGEHEEEILTTSGLLAALAGGKQESEKRIKKILFTGTITNRGIRYSIKISSRDPTIIGRALSEFARAEFNGFAIFLLENKEIRFSLEKEGKPTFFTARKKK